MHDHNKFGNKLYNKVLPIEYAVLLEVAVHYTVLQAIIETDLTSGPISSTAHIRRACCTLYKRRVGDWAARSLVCVSARSWSRRRSWGACCARAGGASAPSACAASGASPACSAASVGGAAGPTCASLAGTAYGENDGEPARVHGVFEQSTSS